MMQNQVFQERLSEAIGVNPEIMEELKVQLDQLKADDQGQPWCNPTALHGTASDQGHNSEVDAHQDSASKRWVGEGWFKISEQRCDDCGRQHLIKHNALHHR